MVVVEGTVPENVLRISAGAYAAPVSDPMPGLVGAYEIRLLLGVGRQRAFMITCRDGFPKPVAELASGRVWRRDDVVAWIGLHRPEDYARITRREAEGL
ncbi:hypothetical protein GCM10025331_47820 [Actinoplanes utahensis]|nr:hypothetical protein Aut01nite_26620 [Actinoplanes utahensis]